MRETSDQITQCLGDGGWVEVQRVEAGKSPFFNTINTHNFYAHLQKYQNKTKLRSSPSFAKRKVNRSSGPPSLPGGVDVRGRLVSIT